MSPTALVKLGTLMELTDGSPDVVIGLLDGPVSVNHPDLVNASILEIPGATSGICVKASFACSHGTLVAGVLAAKRESVAPAICPNCTLLVRPIFGETKGSDTEIPSATPQELAQAILECIDARARVLNLSAALAQPSTKSERVLEEALDYAAKRGVIVVAAAGNQRTLGSTAITRHPWVIPVVAYDLQARPMDYSVLGSSIGRRGLGAPGEGIISLGTQGKPEIMSGTSAAAPFVTGAIALLWSLFPAAAATEVRNAVTQAHTQRRASVIPPLLNAWAAYQTIKR